MKKQTLHKSERLKSKILINKLYNEGKKGFTYPFKFSCLFDELCTSKTGIQILIAVSSKKIKLATKRNLIKRRIREAYRKNRDIINTTDFKDKKDLLLGFTFIGNEPLSYHEIEKKIVLILQQINTGLKHKEQD